MSVRPAAVSAALSSLTAVLLAVNDRLVGLSGASCHPIAAYKLFPYMVAVVSSSGDAMAVVLEALRSSGFNGDVNVSPTYAAVRTIYGEAMLALNEGGITAVETRRWVGLLDALNQPAF